MCGIIGAVNVNIDLGTLEYLKHRGPDDSGLEEFQMPGFKVTLAQTRLSILDLSPAGHQPMLSPCGNYALIFNGEIYNHLDLKVKLTEYTFRGHSDTETILYYLMKYGIGAVKDFNGIFTIAFLDKKQNKLFLIRDPFGVKPLYYYSQGNKLIFSSELQPILSLAPNKELNKENLYIFLRLRFNPSPHTLFKNIYKVEPGHLIEYDLTQQKLLEPVFYSYFLKKDYNLKEGEIIEQFDLLLHRAVKRQLLSDVPIAVLLSGGVDSALLTFLAKKVSNENFRTYTVGYNIASAANELEDARKSARILGTDHKEIIINQTSFSQKLKEFVEIVEEPIGSQSIFPFYYLTEKIHQDGFKVALAGQGIDEAWAGYHRYNPQALFHTYGNNAFKHLGFLNSFIKNDKYRRGLNAISESDPRLRFIEGLSFFDKNMIKSLTHDMASVGREEYLVGYVNEKFKNWNLDEFHTLDSMLYLDSRLALADDLLLYTDKISMRHSLELRVPFLDIDLMQFVESIPYKYKVNLFNNKILYKKLAEKYLPREIINRKKRGFYIPRKEWFKSEAGSLFKKELSANGEAFYQIFSKKYVEGLFDDHMSGKFNYEDQLYSILNVYYWFKQNFN